MTDVNDWRDREPCDDSPEPPDWWLEIEAAEHARRHDDQHHGGGPCNCPPAEPVYSDGAPY